jgi:hypothetical protein
MTGWPNCPNAFQTLETEGSMRGAIVMRCKRTGRHPDECAASCDTHPKDGDVKQAPLVSGAVAKPDAQKEP